MRRNGPEANQIAPLPERGMFQNGVGGSSHDGSRFHVSRREMSGIDLEYTSIRSAGSTLLSFAAFAALYRFRSFWQ